MSHTIVALLQDHPGTLHRVVSLFRRRSYNIESLTVGHSEVPGVSRLTVVVEGEDIEQVTKQLYRLVEVLKVSELTHEPSVEREIALIKVHTPAGSRAEMVALANVFGAKVVDVGSQTMILEIAAYPKKVENFIGVLRPFGIKELLRSGRIAMARGAVLHRAADVDEGLEPREYLAAAT